MEQRARGWINGLGVAAVDQIVARESDSLGHRGIHKTNLQTPCQMATRGQMVFQCPKVKNTNMWGATKAHDFLPMSSRGDLRSQTVKRGAEYFLRIYFNEAFFTSIESGTEKPEASVTAQPQEESVACRGLAPLFLYCYI